MLPCRFGRSARSGAFGPTCSPDPHFAGPPDRILTLVLSTRLCYWGSKFHRTSEMLSVASRPYAPLRFKEVIIIGIGYWYWQHSQPFLPSFKQASNPTSAPFASMTDQGGVVHFPTPPLISHYSLLITHYSSPIHGLQG